MHLHIEADTKCLLFRRRHIQVHLLNENVWITIKNSLKFVPKGPISNNPALVQIMARSRPGNEPLSEQKLVSLTTHICVTRPQWVKWNIKIVIQIVTFSNLTNLCIKSIYRTYKHLNDFNSCIYKCHSWVITLRFPLKKCNTRKILSQITGNLIVCFSDNKKGN